MRKNPSKISRRTVLQGAAAGVAASSVGAGLFTPALAQDTTIRVLSVEDPFFFGVKDLLPEFTAQTGINVELESQSYDALQARLVSSFVSRTSDADVISVDQMWVGQYLDNGWIMPLTEFAANDKSLDIEDFVPAVLYSSNVWRGELVTLPVAAYGQGVLYRNSVLDSLGVQVPADGGWSWADYTSAVEQIHGQNVGGTDMNGTVICGSQPVPIVHMFTQLSASHGVRWFESFPEGEWDFTPTINNDAMEAAISLYKRLYELSPPESINYLWFDAGTRFSTGDIGMFYWWTPYFYLVNNDGYMTGNQSSVVGDVGYLPLPSAPDVPQTISLGGWSFGVPSTSEKAEPAWEFLKWVSSAETQKKMGLIESYGYQFGDFVRKSSYADDELRSVYPFLDLQLDLISAGNGKIARPPSPVYTTLEGILGLELNKVLIGQQDAKGALETVEALFTNVLKGNFLMPYSLESYDDTPERTAELIKRLA